MIKIPYKKRLMIVILLLYTNQIFAQKSAINYYDDGMIALTLQNYYNAAELFKNSLAINPNYTDAMLGSAQAFFFLGEYQESINLLARYDSITTSIAARTLRGRSLAALGQTVQATTIFDAILRVEPNNIDAQFGMAEVYLLSGKGDLAIRNITTLLSVIPDNRRALLSLAILYDDKMNHTMAEQHIVQALFYYPHDPLVLMMAGDHYKKRYNFDKALIYYDAVSTIAPHYNRLAESKADAYFGMGNYDEAASVLEELLRGSGRFDARIWARLASIFEHQANYEMALQCYKEALRLEPNRELTRFAAEEMVKKYYRSGSPERLFYANERLAIGEKYQKAYSDQRALREYRQALILSPDNAKIRFAFASLLSKMGGHFSFIDQLNLIKSKGTATEHMLDILEMEQSRPINSVAKDWRFANGPTGNPIKLYITSIKNRSQVDQVNSEHLLNGAFIRYLERFTRFSNLSGGEKIDFNHAWREARESDSDFFIVTRYIEKNRLFFAEYRLYLTATGNELSNYSANRSSTSKIDEVFTLLTAQLEQTMPHKLKLIRRDGRMALVSGGHLNGLKVGDDFVVIRAGKANFITDPPYFQYLLEDYLGSFKISKTDEYVSEGTLRTTKNPDIIAQEDDLFLIRAGVAPPKSVEPAIGIPEGFLLIH